MSAGSSPEADRRMMARALELARAQLGKTSPNPSVGCVIALGDDIIGEGATGNGGRPHAEELALAQAGDKAVGATAYVTLEPCNQRSGGSTSCSERLLAAGIARVLVACEDPHPLGAHGSARLSTNGIAVEHGLMRAEAERLNAGFFKHVATHRPLVAIDTDASTYDAEFTLAPNETPEAALDRLGAAGLTRVFVRPGATLAALLATRGLIDDPK